ncbi:MAG: hypothetical protein ILO34_07655, partial [Kiritimatiellae bacterium]|nr:hypothetical protein [Kiritimatiellia bacterium]
RLPRFKPHTDRHTGSHASGNPVKTTPRKTPESPYMKSGKRPYKIALTHLCFAETPHMFFGKHGRQKRQ